MSDRERLLLARKVATAVRNPNWGNQTTLDDARIAVDMMLAELDGRIMPELPEGYAVTHVALDDAGAYTADVWTGDDIPRLLCGTGPTIAAAIRNALEADHDHE